MNPRPTTNPSWRADAALEAQILRVEQRLIDRQARLRHGRAAVARDLRRLLRPRRLALPLGATALVVAALLSLRRKPTAAASTTPEPPPARLRLPWLHLAGLAWPLLPTRWRDRVGPATATGLLAVGLPLLDRWAGSPPPPGLQAVAAVDMGRVTGRWFIVGELGSPWQPPACEPPEVGLLPCDDGQYELLMRRIDARGTHGSQGRVDPVPGSQHTRWRVSHWPHALQGLRWAWSELAVLHADAQGETLVLGSPARDTLWLLSRRPAVDEAGRLAAAEIARVQGFEVARLRFMP